MSTDYSDSGISAPAPDRRPSRSGEGGAPVTGALTIVLAVLAVIAGFLILRSIGGDDGGSSAIAPGGAAVTTDPTDASEATVATTDPPTTTTTVPANVFDGAVVVVANANGVNGSAGLMSRALEAAGFEMGDAVNAAEATGQLAESVIYFDPSVSAAQSVAETMNRLMGGDLAIAPVPSAVPTRDGTLEGDVLLMLGNDKAGKSLDELAPAPAAAVTPSPGVAGDPDDPDDPDDPASDE